MKLNYCTECAAPLKQKDRTEYICPNGHTYWNNPRACVAVVIRKDNLILFAERGVEPNKGKFDFPGGFLEYDENLFEAAKREMREETSLEISDLSLITADVHTYLENVSAADIIMLAGSWTGEPQPADDVASLVWKPLEFMDGPEFSLPYPGVSDAIRKHIS